MGIGGLGIGDWGLGIGPNPQSPIPNPQSPSPIFMKINIFKIKFIYYIPRATFVILSRFLDLT